MITTPTVFVLGAGASADYGFPVGEKLLEEMYAFLSVADNQHLVLSILEMAGIPASQPLLLQLQSYLDSAVSIDDLVARVGERNPAYAPIAKLAITAVVSAHETPQTFEPKRVPGYGWQFHRGWYRLLWNLLYENALDPYQLVDNKVTFITFNYDRSLEAYLQRQIARLYALHETDAAKFARQFGVIHAYGQLGLLPWQIGAPQNPYRPLQHEHKEIYAISKQLRTYQEGLGALRAVQRETIRYTIEGASHIYFLGFAFHPLNMRLLRGSNTPYDYPGKTIAGTAYLMGEAAQGRAERELRALFTGHPGNSLLHPVDASDFILNHLHVT